MSETYGEKAIGYIPTEEAIKKLFCGDEKYFDKAARIIAEWYRIETDLTGVSRFENEEDFLENGFGDVAELIDAQRDPLKVHIAGMAFDGIGLDEDI